MKRIKSFLTKTLLSILPLGTVLAQGLDLSGLTHLRPLFKKAQEVLSVEQKASLDPEEVYSVLAIEAALIDQNYEYAAKEAMNFTKYHRVEDKIAEIAVSYYYTKGDYEQAFSVAKYWYKAQPENGVVKAWYAILLGQTDRDQELVSVLQHNLKTANEENFSNKLLENVSILEELQDRQKALHLFEVMSPPLQTIEYHVVYTDFAMRAEQYEKAWNEAFKALDIQQDAEDAAIRVLYLSQGPRRAQGLQFVKAFLEKYPQSRLLYLSYINELSKDDHFDEAIKAIKRMQALSPEDFDLLYYQALIHYDAQQWAMARKVLKQYIDIQLSRQQALPMGGSVAGELLIDARKLLIAIYKIEKKYRLALNEINKIMPEKALPEQLDPELFIEKADVLAKMGSIKVALDVLQEGVEYYPNYRGSFLWLGGNLLNESGRTDQAIVYYNDALKILPQNVDIKYALAMLYEKRGDLWPAEMLLREVMREEPDLADAYNALGYIFANRDYNLAEAQRLLNEAVRLEPNNPYILDSMGWLQFRLKNYALAIEYLEKAFDLREDVEIAAHLAEVYTILGDQLRAKEILQIGKRLDGHNAVLLETMKRLKIEK